MSGEEAMSEKCECPGGPNDEGDMYACIRGTEYGPCDDNGCGGVCEPLGPCPCPLHTTHLGHDSGYGGTYALGVPAAVEGAEEA